MKCAFGICFVTLLLIFLAFFRITHTHTQFAFIILIFPNGDKIYLQQATIIIINKEINYSMLKFINETKIKDNKYLLNKLMLPTVFL